MMHLPLFFPLETEPGQKQECKFFFDVVDIGELMNISDQAPEIVLACFIGEYFYVNIILIVNICVKLISEEDQT